MFTYKVDKIPRPAHTHTIAITMPSINIRLVINLVHVKICVKKAFIGRIKEVFK